MQASQKARRGTQTVRSNMSVRENARLILTQAVKPVFERLEQRQLMTTVWVNDNWVITTDNNAPGLDNGDIVDNSGAGDDSSLSGKTFGTHAFSSIASAQGAINNTDTIHVVSGLYTSGPTTITKEITIEGDNAGVAGTGSRANESVLGASGGGLVISANNVVVDGLKIADATSGNAGIVVSSGASDVTISHNIITNNSVGMVVSSGAGNFIVSDNLISTNNRAGASTGQGISVGANSGTGSILRNTISGHTNGASTAGVNLAGSLDVSIGTVGNGNTFDANTVAIRISGATTGTSIAGNTLNGTNTTYIDYGSSGELNAASNSYNGVSPSGNSANLAQQYAIVNKITDGVDLAGPGLVRIDPTHVYVTSASETSSAGSISRGVGLASATNTVHVGAGTFVDQISITQSLNLVGAGNTTVINPIASLATLFTSPNLPNPPLTNKPVIYANGSNAINISQIKVDGLGLGNSNYRFMGIAYYNAGGTVDQVTVTGIRDNPLGGAQHGAGIYANVDDAVARTVQITNNTVTDYQKVGIIAAGATLTANITGNTVTGTGATIAIAQNGIQLLNGAGGNITNNTISGNQYDGAGSGADPATSVQSAGILMFNPASGVSVTGNIINGNDIGIYSLANGANISSNTLGGVSANRYEGIFIDQGSATLTSNTITGGAMGIAVYSFGGNTGDSTATISGGTISSTTGVQVFDDDLLGDSYVPVASVSGVNLAGTGGTGYGVNVDGGTAMIQNSNLSGHLVGLQVASGAIVDAGSDVGDGNPTGLGTSAGNNDLTGYTGTGGSYAISNENLVANTDPNVLARNNNFGNPVTPAIVEGRIFDDTDDVTRTQVIYTDPQNLASPPSVVWVDDSWAAVVPGNDANGAGPGTVFGYDQFSSIQDAVSALASVGTVNIAVGTYVENITVNKVVTFTGPNNGAITGRLGAVSPTTEAVVTAANVGLPAMNLVTGSAGSTVRGLAFSGGGVQLQGSSGPLDGVQVLDDVFVGFTGSAISMVAAGRNMTFLRLGMDGSSQTGSAAILSFSSALYDGLFLQNSTIRNGGTNNDGMAVDGDHNIIPSIGGGGRNPLITGNTFQGNRTGMNLGARSFSGGQIGGSAAGQTNRFVSNDFDGLAGGIQNSSIIANMIELNGQYGLNLTSFGNTGPTYGAQNNNIRNNTFDRNGIAELFLDGNQDVGTMGTNLINQNSFGLPASAPASITLTASPTVMYGGGDTIDMTLNWWNNVAGPTGGGHVGGTGSAVLTGAGAANLDVAPWIRAATDTGGIFGNGFQPDLSQRGHDAMSLSGGVSVNEGSTYTVTYAYNGDPDMNAVTSLVINWGDGTSTTIVSAAGNGTATHVFADSPDPVYPSGTVAQAGPPYSIQIFAVDPSASYGMFPVLPVTVDNVAPTLAPNILSTGAVNEGATFTLTLGAVTDPGTDVPFVYRIDWGDGTAAQIITNGQLNSQARKVTHVYRDDPPAGTTVDSYTITVDMQDEDSPLLPGGFYTNMAQSTITVSNTSVAPSVATTAAATIAEASTNTLTFNTGKAASVTDSISYSLSIIKDGTTTVTTSTGSGNYSSAILFPTVTTTVSASVTTTITNFNSAFRFIPTDNGTYVINFTARDDDQAVDITATARTFNVTNATPAPTIAGVTTSPNEGSNNTLTFQFNDPAGAGDAPFVYSWSITKGGNPYTSATTVSTTATSVNIPFVPNDNATYVVTANVSDKDGANGVATARTITVNNVNPAPTVNPTSAVTISEGGSSTFTATSTDPGSLDTVTYAWTAVRGTVTLSTGAGSTYNFVPNVFGTYGVRLTATDNNGGASTVTKTITVGNVAPTPSIAGAPANTGEGSTVGVTGVSGDPGTADAFTYTWSVTKAGNPYASATSTNSAFNFSPNDNAVYVVSLNVRDSGGLNANATAQTITATNVAPSPTIVGAPTVSPEGTSISLNSTVTDAGSLDTTFTYAWNVTKDGNPYASGTNTNVVFTPDDNAAYVVTLDATDKDGGVGSTTKTITVTDANPTITLSGSSAINEGQTATITFGAITDPAGANDTISQYRVVWGDGSDTGFLAGTPTGTMTHRYDDGTATRTVTVELIDEDGLHPGGTQAIVVSNVNPTGVFSGSTPVSLGDNGTVIWATHTDPSNDDNANLVYDYDFNNDGTYEVVGSLSPSATVPAAFLSTVGPTHVIASRIRDNDGGSFSATFNIAVNDASFRVISFSQNNSGFGVQFNKPASTAGLNLYDGNDAPVDATDLVVMRTGSPNPVRGSLVWDGSTNTATWVATGGVLVNDTYSITLVSGASAWTAGGSDFLDGNTGLGGTEDYVQNFVISGSTPVVSLPDFTRGAGQGVRMPSDLSAGLPISISSPVGVTSVDFDIFFNPTLLDITAASLDAAVPGGWTITPAFTSISSTLKKLRITASGGSQLSGIGSPMAFVQLTATVPNTAGYGSTDLIRVENVVVNAGSGRGDYAVHKAAYIGDATGNGSYSGSDKSMIDRVIAGLDSGFDFYQLTDPVIVADMDSNGLLQGQDSSWFAQASLNPASRPEVPIVPVLSLAARVGPDPTFDIPDNITVVAGGVIDIPINITDSAANLGGFDVYVNYTSSKLSLTGGENSPDITLGSFFSAASGWNLNTFVNQATGTAKLMFSRLVGMTGGTGAIANLHFQVAGDFTGSSNLTTSGLASDSGADGSPLSFTYLSGSVTTDVLTFNYNTSPSPMNIKVTGNYTAAQLVLTNNTTASVIPTGNISASFSGGVTTFTFPGYAHGALPNGDYQAVIDGSKTLDFFIVAGDANHDRKVDINDLNILSSNWQQSGKVFSQGDFDFDGDVDADDLGILSANWQTSLSAGPSQPISIATTPAKRGASRR